MTEHATQLVSAQWLATHLNDPDLVILFTSMADIKTGIADAIPDGLIPGSRWFDFEHTFCDTQSGLPHTMPDATVFETQARKLGIRYNSQIVVYDNKGLYCAARVWWMFRAMGHRNIQILDGGLPAWLARDYPLVSDFDCVYPSGDFIAATDPQAFVDAATLLHNPQQFNLIDARSAGRFKGTEPEPRPGLRSGHMPGAYNLPFNLCIDNGHLKSTEALQQLFASLHLPADKQLVFSCGSGVTACILALAAMTAGYEQLRVYDGSWSEWGGRSDWPIEI